MEINLSELKKIFGHSSELAKSVEKSLAANTISIPETTRLKSMFQQMQMQASTMETQLEQLSSQYQMNESNAKLQLWERKLLDLTFRNNLLNMRLGKNAITFDCNDIATLEDSLDDGNEIILTGKEIKQLYRTVRTNMEETGANTLFLTLGDIGITEQQLVGTKKEKKIYKAPILLMPVDIISMGKDRYAIRKRDEDVILNITLMEFLKQNYEITLQQLFPLPKDNHGVDVNLVLHLFREAIKDQTDWTIEENSVLGVFSFTKFVMWNDIHTHSTEMLQNDLIRSLVEGRLLLNNDIEPADARQLDLLSRPNDYALPVAADSSQLEAVIDAGKKRSFVLFGPPGTGKSQTITNIIANAMLQNQRVLFVAEKKAALEVVQNRLEKIGLSPFCLEIHSNKMDKKKFLQQMQDIIDFIGEKSNDEYEKIATSLLNQRMQLIGYIEALHKKRSNGFSLYDCINRHLSLSQTPITLPKELAGKLQKEQVEALYDKCFALETETTLLGMPHSEHPMRGLYPKSESEKSAYSSYQIAGQKLEDQLQTLPQTINEIKKQIERNKSLKFNNKTTRQYFEMDYRWKKFIQVADIDKSLLDDIDAMCEAANRWSENINTLPEWKKHIEHLEELRQEGLNEAVDLYLTGISGKDVAEAFMSGFYKLEALHIINQEPTLSQFNGLMFDQVIEKYKVLTDQFQELTRKELIAKLVSQNPCNSKNPEISAELTLLRKRIGNNGRGTSIRGIIDQMPHLLSLLCPCMLMSPLSVAQYLDINGEKFDLVIFDEASQMPTCEAVGAISRGKSLVVVGDPKQMPPTNFFNTSITDEEDAELDDLDSILDDCISLSMPYRYLSWHYRSRHESLIAFSNINYYDGKLVTFPSADDMQKKVTHQHIDGVYDFGKTRTNIYEAKYIVTEIMNRLESYRKGELEYRSIGVIAFSKVQSDLIEDILNEEFAKQPDLDAYNRESKEPLFVKNLENVQGDERDIILFSVCYGPDAEGKVSMNFGPLNQAGGERRLNVAVSRARYEMKIFSTLEPEQIDERRTSAEGVIGLKHFLEFAKNGILEQNKSTQKTIDKISKQIATEIEKYGYQVHTCVGTSAFQIDVAIVDPECESQYKLGILLDGDGYYNTKTVRDREIVQPIVLQSLGWNLMHVWSLDWFSHPDVVIKNILNKIKECNN